MPSQRLSLKKTIPSPLSPQVCNHSNTLFDAHSFFPFPYPYFPSLPPSSAPNSCTFLLPGYPLSALPASCRDPLQRVLAKCPQVSLENSFRCCLDSLLGEIKSGSASYGTRIMLFLLIERNSSVCVEAAKMVRDVSARKKSVHSINRNFFL